MRIHALCIAPLPAPFFARSTRSLHFNIAVMGARLSSPAAPSTLNVKDEPAPSHPSHESNVDVRLLHTSSPFIIIIIIMITIIAIITTHPHSALRHFLTSPAAPRRGFLAGGACPTTTPNIATPNPHPFPCLPILSPTLSFLLNIPQVFCPIERDRYGEVEIDYGPPPPPSPCTRAAAFASRAPPGVLVRELLVNVLYPLWLPFAWVYMSCARAKNFEAFMGNRLLHMWANKHTCISFHKYNTVSRGLLVLFNVLVLHP